MSAGSGVEHSEMNASATDHAKHCNYGFSWHWGSCAQIRPEIIWYSNQYLFNVVSPKDQNDGNALWVYQKLFFHLGIFDANSNTTYQVQILITVFIYFNRRRNNG
jgi:hypothetical protein